MTETWTPLRLIAWTQGYLSRAAVDAPRLTAELLLAEALRCDRMRLYLDFDKPVAAAELASFRALVKRRAEGEPTAWLTGRREFMGHSFRCDARALIPRPETEHLVEALLTALGPAPAEGASLLDLCTGTGCVAISAALERPGARVVATDLSAEALALAAENAAALGARVALHQGDLYAALPGGQRFDAVVANPPYLPSSELAGLSREVQREPALALDGGPDGLALLARIVAGAPSWLRPGGILAVEMHESHGQALSRLCAEAGLEGAEVRRDLAGLPRLVVARAKR